PPSLCNPATGSSCSVLPSKSMNSRSGSPRNPRRPERSNQERKHHMKTITKNRVIYITEADMRRLEPLIEAMKNSRDDLRALQAELATARVVAPKEVPPDVITMN